MIFSHFVFLPVIYHYSVIVEMFCISLFAHHTFRKVEPCHGEGEEMEIDVIRVLNEKAIQTEDELPIAVQLSSQEDEPCHSNLGYNSDSEDSLCKIEHAPLDCFPFPLQHRLQTATNMEKVHFTPPEDSMNVELSTITVSAEINHIDSGDVTVV